MKIDCYQKVLKIDGWEIFKFLKITTKNVWFKKNLISFPIAIIIDIGVTTIFNVKINVE